MEASARRRSRRLPYVLRIMRARPRLSSSAAIGVAAFLALPAHWRLPTRLLGGWDVGIACYLILVYSLMARAHVGLIRERAAIEDEGRVAILVLTVSAALASLGAIVVELGTAFGSNREAAQLALATATILLSWGFTHTIFAMHYAHEFYSENGRRGGGLVFPGNEEPDYWDFVYFSFVIGMTSQVSDVAVSCKPIRRTVAAHGILSFMFNTALLALTVNIAAGAIQEQ
jgi:uncharacterized membrane protein